MEKGGRKTKEGLKPKNEANKEEIQNLVQNIIKNEEQTISILIEVCTLILICAIAFGIRLFSVVKWESVIHEFDPYFNFRTTKFLANEGFNAFINWFDDRSWYPLGRVVGGSIYPGLMASAAVFHKFWNLLGVSINIRNVCVFLAPIFAGLTALATHLFVKETMGRTRDGLLAAAFVAIVPSYISRSVAGSYDNEGVAIFALVFTFYLWVKSVNTGSMFWGLMCALAYFYMVAAWGGYVFIINMIPIHVVVLILSGRYSSRLYVAYSTFYAVGSILAMQVPFVGFNVVRQAECAASHGVFIGIQAYAFGHWLKSNMGSEVFWKLIRFVIVGIVGGVVGVILFNQLAGYTQWTGRSMTLLDPTYAKKFIPIIASVSEHQPTAWTSFFMDLHILVPLAPLGLYLLYKQPNDAKIFMILYGTISWWFAGIMVRLMLPLAPVACCLAGVSVSKLLSVCIGWIKDNLADDEEEAETGKKKDDEEQKRPTMIAALAVLGFVVLCCSLYVLHCVFISSQAYSSPSIVMASRAPDGTRVIFDDYREAYYWLRQNTAEDAKIMSWWDYGYQISGMSNRTVIVDNNTWNNTHIATVGRAFGHTEQEAYPIIKSLDVDYVLVIFGGVIGYSSDDLNKFLWMIRIASGVYPDEVRERDFLVNGQMRLDTGGSDAMLNSLMYSLSYYNFDKLRLGMQTPPGYDRVRQVQMGRRNIKLEHFEEAYTSEHWIVRIYKVKKEPALDVSPMSGVIPKKAKKKVKENVRFVGCFDDEKSFGMRRQYIGGPSAATFGSVHAEATQKRKRFMATARNSQDGHAFIFNRNPGTPTLEETKGCVRPCLDDKKKRCGCADAGCGKEPIPEGLEENRRWAVYEILQ